jgi:hypothetical protein
MLEAGQERAPLFYEVMDFQRENYQRSLSGSTRSQEQSDIDIALGQDIYSDSRQSGSVRIDDDGNRRGTENGDPMASDQNGEPTLRDALRWAQNNKAKYDIIRDGNLGLGEIEAGIRNSTTPELDRKMLSLLKENFEDIRNSHRDRKRWGKEKNCITDGDLRESLEDIEERQRALDRLADTEHLADRLLDGDPSLFAHLDSIDTNGYQDGKISENDLRIFLSNYDLLSTYSSDSSPSAPYTAENANVVRALVDQWDNPLSPTARLRGIVTSRDLAQWSFDPDRYRYISLDSVARALANGVNS